MDVSCLNALTRGGNICTCRYVDIHSSLLMFRLRHDIQFVTCCLVKEATVKRGGISSEEYYIWEVQC